MRLFSCLEHVTSWSRDNFTYYARATLQFLGLIWASIGWSLWVVRPIVATFSSSPSFRLHSNSCINLAIAVQLIVIACWAPAHTLFPAPNAIVFCNSIGSYFPLRNRSGFHSSGLSHTFLSLLQPYIFIAICAYNEYRQLIQLPDKK